MAKRKQNTQTKQSTTRSTLLSLPPKMTHARADLSSTGIPGCHRIYCGRLWSETLAPLKTMGKQSTCDDRRRRRCMRMFGWKQPAHVKACFLGSSLTLPISDGRLALGTWQGIWLCEHRNQAGSRKLMVTLQGCLRPDTSLGSSGGMRNSRSPAHPGADSPLASTSS